MRRVAAAAAAVLALALAACGDDRPFPAACNDSARTVQDALARAPGRVVLTQGTRLSACVERARGAADVQTVGALYTAVADDLAAKLPRSDAAALRLGYLLGATRRGARRTNGIHEELVRRLEQSTGLDGAPPARRSAFGRGRAAGLRDG